MMSKSSKSISYWNVGGDGNLACLCPINNEPMIDMTNGSSNTFVSMNLIE